MRWPWRVAHMGERERRVQGFGGKPGGKRTLGRPRRRWEDDIKMDLQIGVWTGLIWLTTGIGAGFL